MYFGGYSAVSIRDGPAAFQSSKQLSGQADRNRRRLRDPAANHAECSFGLFSEYTLGTGLPIFSYGGTGMLMNAMILGMLLSIAAYKDVTQLELFTAVER